MFLRSKTVPLFYYIYTYVGKIIGTIIVTIITNPKVFGLWKPDLSGPGVITALLWWLGGASFTLEWR